MIIVSVSSIITVIVVILAAACGGLGLLFEWIAENKSSVLIIWGIIMLIGTIILSRVTKKRFSTFQLLICNVIVHIPFIKFIFVLTENVLKVNGDVLLVFLVPFGRVIITALMLLPIVLFYVMACWLVEDYEREEELNGYMKKSLTGSLIVTTICSVIASILILLLYIYW